ncbi:MAG: hypothetical protein LBT59_14730 [Clostridiales bacterium]|jgi:antitoxin (DNA-binding transcriptional repressor) of toxin-antitoxin stability system|nr:hypothetical protein [Clostridiales bacterium]
MMKSIKSSDFKKSFHESTKPSGEGEELNLTENGKTIASMVTMTGGEFDALLDSMRKAKEENDANSKQNFLKEALEHRKDETADIKLSRRKPRE